MNERSRPSPNAPRNMPGTAVPEAQAAALQRRMTLEQQQRTYQIAYPTPHIFRRRPPG